MMQGSCRTSLAASSSHPVLQSISPHNVPLPYKSDPGPLTAVWIPNDLERHFLDFCEQPGTNGKAQLYRCSESYSLFLGLLVNHSDSCTRYARYHTRWTSGICHEDGFSAKGFKAMIPTSSKSLVHPLNHHGSKIYVHPFHSRIVRLTPDVSTIGIPAGAVDCILSRNGITAAVRRFLVFDLSVLGMQHSTPALQPTSLLIV
ncbi:hypothetical protein P692DRAFT_20839641 [Suillus brevipes Sb2]|nr:hypothetical protein P692DRAFT_201798425 [Suillus brevipes Sb2]KAG2742056.1 hypothetical protein P692DRAFT_20839641 [Suillus brevipes Sb2]